MKRLLLDTNIVTYMTGDSTWKDLYLPMIAGADLFISFMTLAELMEKAYRTNLSERNRQREMTVLKGLYEIIPFTEDICDHFGQIRAKRRNRPISVPDALIAATALAYDLPLVTHNKKDFEGISAELKIASQYKPPE